MYLIKKINFHIKNKIVHPLYKLFLPVKKAINSVGKYYCPICESNVINFQPFGDPPRPLAQCPLCNSLERHRLNWVFMTKRTDLLTRSPQTMLHIAPEEFLTKKFKNIKNLEYLSADINSPQAMVKMDITNIQYPDNSFSIIYCSHVLEHIEDDRKAITELYRVLKHGGWAVIQVPISEKTYEDPTIVEPQERKKYFRQEDHVRLCGPDYIERIKAGGFTAQTIRATDIMTESEYHRIGSDPQEMIFFCQKL